MKSDEVVLVDQNDQKVGSMDIRAAHQGRGTLHRAISVLLYRRVGDQAEILLQKRSSQKPLWPLCWTNTICTHPRDGESYEHCAIRRLYEEMGISLAASDLSFVFELLYQARYNELLSEHELDRVYIGKWNGSPNLNPKEVADFSWTPWSDAFSDVLEHPQIYTPWFIKLMVNSALKQKINSITS